MQDMIENITATDPAALVAQANGVWEQLIVIAAALAGVLVALQVLLGAVQRALGLVAVLARWTATTADDTWVARCRAGVENAIDWLSSAERVISKVTGKPRTAAAEQGAKNNG